MIAIPAPSTPPDTTPPAPPTSPAANPRAAAIPVAPPGPLDGLERCPVTPDGWILPAEGYPWKVSRRHYIFWEAVFAINFLWITAACYNLNMTTLWSTLPLILWMLVIVRASVLFTSLYARVCSTGMIYLVMASYSANLMLTLILFTHMLVSGARYSPISIFTAFELLYELFVLAVLQLPAYRWPLKYWMLRRDVPVYPLPAISAAAALATAGDAPASDSAGNIKATTP